MLWPRLFRSIYKNRPIAKTHHEATRKFVRKYLDEAAKRPPVIQYSIGPLSPQSKKLSEQKVAEFIENRQNKTSFSEYVLKTMTEEKISPKEFYSRTGMDRRLFSALKNGGKDYQPSRNTAIRCCFALQLSFKKSEELLKIAGYALSDSKPWDLIVRYCIENKVWNVFDVDGLLDSFGQESLFT